jgi:hypothetical protein
MRYNFKFGNKFLLAPKTDFGGIYSTLVAGYYALFINSIGSDDVILDRGGKCRGIYNSCLEIGKTGYIG